MKICPLYSKCLVTRGCRHSNPHPKNNDCEEHRAEAGLKALTCPECVHTNKRLKTWAYFGDFDFGHKRRYSLVR